MKRRTSLHALLGAPALWLAGCGSGSDDHTTELPLVPVRISLAGLHDVPTGAWLFHQASEVADFLARHEHPTQVCDSAGHCVPGHTPPPELDFERQALAGWCAGPSSSCETMAITRVRLRGDTAILDVRLAQPEPADGIACPAVVTWLTAFVQVPASVQRVEAVRV